MSNVNPVTDSRLQDFLYRLSDMYKVYYETMFSAAFAATFSAETGRKYIRIVITNHSQRSVYCFIERETGNILKDAGWKAPAKGARGNIWNDFCDVGNGLPCNIHGSNLYK